MFANILGNEKIKESLQNSVKAERISHSYLFIGTDGIGKKMIASEFAKMILCLDKNNKYCNNCKSCIEFDTNNNPDFKIIKPDGNSIKIEQIREIQDKIAEKPIISNKKAYIIDDADKMTQEAQNCLLKTLEEPPEYATIILIGSNETAFLSTIKSRCIILHFEKIKDEEIAKFIREKYQIEIDNQNLLKAAQGSIGKAIQLKEDEEIYSKIDEIISNLENADNIDILKMAEIIYKSKDKINDILEYMNIIFIDIAKKSNKYANCINIVEDAKKRLQSNVNFDMCIDNMLLNLWEQVN